MHLDQCERLCAIAGGIRFEVELAEHAADHFGGYAVVFGDQDSEIFWHG